MKLIRFNEQALWQKDIREINDIFNIIRDDPEFEIVRVTSKVALDSPVIG